MHCASLLLLIVLVWVAGFGPKFVSVVAGDGSVRWWDLFKCFNVDQMFLGSGMVASVALIVGALQWCGLYGGGRAMHHGGFWFNTPRVSDAGDKSAMIILIVIGLLIALYFIYKFVKSRAVRLARATQGVVLDVHAHEGDEGVALAKSSV